MRPVLAEALGTFWIVLVAAGLLAEGLVAPGLGAGAAAGLAYLAAALTLGQITMGHFNPALTVGLRAVGGFGGSLTFTLLAQVAGASLALLIVGPPPEPAAEIRPFPAMLLLVPLVALPVLLHLGGMRLRSETVAHANAAALVVAVALAPGGHAGLSAAHATAAWLTGDGAPIGLWRIWLATGVAVALAAALWKQLPQESRHAVTSLLADAGQAAPARTAPEAEDGVEDAAPGQAQGAARIPVPGAPAATMTPEEALVAQAMAMEALVEAGWTPPRTEKGGAAQRGAAALKPTQKGRAPKNAPLSKSRRMDS